MPTQTFFHLKEEKRETVMRAAVCEFVKHGFSRAKISDIAKRASISKGSVFQYFADKKELFIYCAEWGLSVFLKKVEMHNLGDMDIFDYFNDVTPRFDIMREESELVSFMQIAMSEPELVDETMKRMFDIGNIYTQKLIQNGQKKGTVRKDINGKLLLEFLNGVTLRFKMRWMKLYMNDLTAAMDPKREKAMRKELKEMQALIRGGVGLAPPPPRP